MKRTPTIDATYWATIMVGSVFGANVGDYLSDALHLGHLRGLPLLAGLLAVVLTAERFVGVGGALFYWAAIIVIRAAATNVGDSLHDAGIGFAWSVPATSVLLIAVVTAATVHARRTGADGRIRIDAPYWIAMILAGALGTLAGDWVSYPLHFGNVGAMLVFGAALSAVFAAGGARLATSAGFYWTAIVLIRSAGTAAGDLLAHRFIGITASTAVTGVIFVAIAVAFYGRSDARTLRSNDPARLLPAWRDD